LEAFVESQESQPPGNSRRRLGARRVQALVLEILTTALIGVSTVLSWWDLSATSVGSTSGFYLNSTCNGPSCGSYESNQALAAAFAVTFALVIGSLALSVLALSFLLMSTRRPGLAAEAVFTGVIGSVLLLAAPVYLYFALPAAIGPSVSGFFGSYRFSPSSVFSWGGGPGWFMAFVALSFYVASTLVVYRGFSPHRSPGHP